jgi:hypothetical protein
MSASTFDQSAWLQRIVYSGSCIKFAVMPSVSAVNPDPPSARWLSLCECRRSRTAACRRCAGEPCVRRRVIDTPAAILAKLAAAVVA